MDIQEQITYFRQLSEQYSIESVRLQLIELSKKRKDKNLYLAVVGEFSSGKSSFINALLGKRLLKEAVMPTTACATYIKKGENDIEIDVEFSNTKFHVSEQNTEVLDAYLNEHYDILNQDIQSLIDTLTSEQSVAHDITSLTLSIPDIDIPDNIVIIDTPGFNPGEISVQNHFEVTKKVVEKYADVAIILMPTNQPFSNSLKVFLQSYLRKYIHRCIFVLTKGDLKNKDERKMLCEFVQSRLSADFGLTETKVLCESAITMLPVVRIPDNLKEEWDLWRLKFCQFKQLIWSYLARRHEIILSEHLDNLALDLTKELQARLQTKQMEFDRQKAQIDAARIPHIRALTEDLILYSETYITASIENVRNELKAQIEKEKTECLSSARKNLYGYNVLNDFESKIKPMIAEEVHERLLRVLKAVNEMIISSVQSTMKTEFNKIQQEFTHHYSMFPSLQRKDNGIELTVNGIDISGITFGDTAQVLDKERTKENEMAVKKLGGLAAMVAAGAAIGSIVPGIGWVTGALAGLITYTRSPNNNSKKVETEIYLSVKKAMEEEIKNYFLSAERNMEWQLSELQCRINQTMKDYANRHIEKYGSSVEALIQQQEEASKTAQQNINAIKKVLCQMKKTEDEIKYNLLELKIQK